MGQHNVPDRRSFWFSCMSLMNMMLPTGRNQFDKCFSSLNMTEYGYKSTGFSGEDSFPGLVHPNQKEKYIFMNIYLEFDPLRL